MRIFKRTAIILLAVCILVSATSCLASNPAVNNGDISHETEKHLNQPDDKYDPSVDGGSDNGSSNGSSNGVTPENNLGNRPGDEQLGDNYPTDFEGDIVIGSRYFDGENIASINNNMHFLIVKGDSFTLDSIEVLPGMRSGIQKTGKFTYSEGSGIYTLKCDDGEVLYGKMDGALFMYCNEDGSPVDTVTGRSGDGVTEVSINVRAGNSDYGYRDLSKNQNGDEMQRLYRDLLEIYEGFYDSTEDISAVGDRYILAKLPISEYEISIDEIVSVWKIFGLENPAYYYFNNTLFVEGGELIFCVDPDYAKAADRAGYKADIKNMESECAATLVGKNSELLRAMAIHDYVVTEINYAYKADGTTPEDAAWAHNIIGTASKKMGVCETYAKTIQYLCLINGVEAITLAGQSGEPHGWNLLKINGKWYGVDATWNDTGDNSKLSYDCFGMSYNNMTLSHTHDMPISHGITYLYDIPTVSNYDIQLVTLYKNGESMGLLCGIDDAFSKMTDKNADYVIELFNYTDSGPLLLSTPNIQHYVFSSRTPDVKSISIEGTYKHFEGGFIVITPIFIANTNGLTVTSDFAIRDMEFVGVDMFIRSGLFLENVTLSFNGGCCESEVDFIFRTENDTSSTIVANTEEIAIYSDIDIHRIEGGSIYDENGRQSHITLRGDVNVDVVELSILNLTAYGRTKVNVSKFIGVGEYATITFGDTDAVIGDIVVDKADVIKMSMRFGKLNEVSSVAITGSVNAPIELVIDGQKVMQSTDLAGNVLDNWVEVVDPFDVESVFLTINSGIRAESVAIKFIEWRNDGGGYDTEKTALYELNAKYQFVMGDVVHTADGFIIKGDTLIRYTGNNPTPTIPVGITEIYSHAFFDCDFITSITVPEGVTSIGKNAFMFCTNMESLSLPKSLTSFDHTLFGFGGNTTSISGSYAGSVSEWRSLVMRALANDESTSFNIDTITCRDGVTYAGSALPRNNSYSSCVIGDQWYNYQEYSGFGMACFVFMYNDNGEADIRRCTYLNDGRITGTSVSRNGLPFNYQYSSVTGVYTVNVNGTACYIKLTNSGFEFCDSSGNALTSLPVPLR